MVNVVSVRSKSCLSVTRLHGNDGGPLRQAQGERRAFDWAHDELGLVGVLEGGYAWEGAAFEEFQGCSAAGGDVGHGIGEAE